MHPLHACRPLAWRALSPLPRFPPAPANRTQFNITVPWPPSGLQASQAASVQIVLTAHSGLQMVQIQLAQGSFDTADLLANMGVPW